MLNITAVGRLGKDPELRTIPGKDYEITAFSLAVNVFAKGEQQTVWLKCSIWGKKWRHLPPVRLPKGHRSRSAGSCSKTSG